MRELTKAHDILLILDETVTGFRVAAGGCQEHYGIEPDIATFGKALGAGFPVAAFVGRAEIMEALAWGGVLHYGTQNASRLGLYAARASLKELTANGATAFKHTWHIGERLAAGFRNLFDEMDTAAIVQGVGPMFQILFTDRPAIRDYREFCAHVDRAKYQKFALALFRHGVYMSPSAALHSVVSIAHQEEQVMFTLTAARKALTDAEG